MQFSKEYTGYVLALTISALTTALYGCMTTEDHWNVSAEHATQAREKYMKGMQNVRAKAKQISDLLNRYRQIPILQSIINEPVVYPITDTTFNPSQAQIGTYVETEDGSFSFTPGPDIVVQYLNGIDFIISQLSWHSDQRLAGYRLTALGHMRGITTPTPEDVRLQLKFVSTGNSIAPPAAFSGGILAGEVFFYPPGQSIAASYHFSRRISTMETLGRYLDKLRYHSITDRNTNRTAEAIELIQYTTVEHLPGLWAGFNYSHQYTEADLSYRISWQTNPNTLSVTGTASFLPANAVLKSLYGVYAPQGIVRVGYQGRPVAVMYGGPFVCDMTMSNDPGAGSPIQLEWVGGTTDESFPSADFTCTSMTLNKPSVM